MSNFSIAYDAVNTRLSSLFPNKIKLPNPYSTEENGEPFLVDSYGVRIGDSTGIEGEFITTIDDQVFDIVLTMEAKGQETDPETWGDVGVLLKNDSITIRKDFLNGDFINQNNSIDRIEYISTSAISLVGDKRKFLEIVLTLNFRISEDLK